MQAYYLDLSTLLQILSRQKRSGTLTIEHVHMPNVRGNISVSIEIEHGGIRSCLIIQKQAIVASGQTAIQALLALQPLEWQWSTLPSPKSPPPRGFSAPPENAPVSQTFAAEQSTQSLPHKPFRETIFMPQQTHLAQNPKILQQLSRQHRRVLSLIDGNRTYPQIAGMLIISIADLSRYTNDLEQWGLISLRPS